MGLGGVELNRHLIAVHIYSLQAHEQLERYGVVSIGHHLECTGGAEVLEVAVHAFGRVIVHHLQAAVKLKWHKHAVVGINMIVAAKLHGVVLILYVDLIVLKVYLQIIGQFGNEIANVSRVLHRGSTGLGPFGVVGGIALIVIHIVVASHVHHALVKLHYLGGGTVFKGAILLHSRERTTHVNAHGQCAHVGMETYGGVGGHNAHVLVLQEIGQVAAHVDALVVRVDGRIEYTRYLADVEHIVGHLYVEAHRSLVALVHAELATGTVFKVHLLGSHSHLEFVGGQFYAAILHLAFMCGLVERHLVEVDRANFRIVAVVVVCAAVKSVHKHIAFFQFPARSHVGHTEEFGQIEADIFKVCHTQVE